MTAPNGERGGHEGASVEWLEKEWASNDLQGMVLMGSNYFVGNGVPQDCNWAVQLFVCAAISGDPDAKRFMGFAYMTGSGVPQDLDRARDWFESAAQEGNAKAQANLGEFFFQANSPPDYTNAIAWITRSALQGYAPAQSDLGMFYEVGRGVKEDMVEALTWLQLAANGGSRDAAEQLNLMEAVADPPQKQEAERRVQAFKPISGRETVPGDTNVATCHLGDNFVIPVQLFGKSTYMIVDTASTFSTLDTGYKNRLGDMLLKLRSSRLNVEMYGAPDVFINNVRFPLLLATVADMQKISQLVARPLAGILGMDLLKRHVICFDPDKSTFKIGGSVPEDIKSNALAIPLIETSKNEYGIQVFLNGHPFLLTIDSGYNGSVSLDDKDWEEVFPGRAENFRRSLAVTYGSRIEETKSARLQRLNVGTNAYTNLITECISGPQSSSTLGMDFLRRHVCTFDFPNHTLYLQKGVHFDRPDEEDMSGLSLLSDNGRIEVYSVDKDSPASRAGMAAGDVIVLLNGKAVSASDISSVGDALSAGPGVKISVQVDRKGVTKKFSFILVRMI